MKSGNTAKLAESIGVSKAAVSLAVNHCPGLSSEVRERILGAASEQGITGKPSKREGIYLLIPESPVYFWGELYDELIRCFKPLGDRVKYNIYSRIGDRASVEHYLDEAVRLNSRVIIAAAKHDGLDERLESLAHGQLVISLCEATNARNVFFIGSNRISDGERLAQLILADNPDVKRLLLCGDDSGRTEGIRLGAPHCEMRVISNIESRSPYELARKLDEAMREFAPDAVVSLSGFTNRICMAIDKCGFSKPCYGFEHQPIEKRYSSPAGEICQNLSGIAEATYRAVVKYLECGSYPDAKSVYVESIVRKDQ